MLVLRSMDSEEENDTYTQFLARNVAPTDNVHTTNVYEYGVGIREARGWNHECTFQSSRAVGSVA